MFTGIIEETGTITDLSPCGSGIRLTIRADLVLEDVEIGSSIAVNGCCLTVTSYSENFWCADAVPETMERTNLGSLAEENLVNLERPVQANGRLGGHIVQGHIDSTATITAIQPLDDGSYVFSFAFGSNWRQYVSEKGSIAIDGISLTVANVDQSSFSVAVIPHTWNTTNLSEKTIGDRVNIEVDVLAKYVERQLLYLNVKAEDSA